MTTRRGFLTGFAAALLIKPADAQPGARVARLGVLLYGTLQGDPGVAALRRGLQELGYVEPANLSIGYRFAEGRPDRLPALAAELVALGPHVIVAFGGDVAPVAQRATRTIPIVMLVSNDPVQAGLVASLARPGGNMTGVTLILDALAGKRLGLLRELVPRVTRVGILWNPEHADPEFREVQGAARTLGVQLHSLEARRGEDLDAAFRTATAERCEAILAVSSRLMNLHRRRILDFAGRQRLPVIGDWGPWVPEGALLSYGPNIEEMNRRTAGYVDRILKGARPADLPVQQPTRFELVVNLAVARGLGIAVPQSILVRADRVIE